MSRSLTILTLTFLSFFLFQTNAYTQDAISSENLLESKIYVSQTDRSLTIEPTIKNISPLYLDIEYEVITIKKGISGSSTNRQSGQLTLDPGKLNALSKIVLIVSNNDLIEIKLEVKDEKGNLIHQDYLSNQQSTNKTNPTTLPQKKVSAFDLAEGYGLLIDETRTKPGRDFYYFYSNDHYNTFRNIPETVVIKEIPGFGLRSIIRVEVDNELILEARLDPKVIYLEQLAKDAINRTSRYLQIKAKRDKEDIIY